MKYEMTCYCGDVFSVDADSREAAVAQIKEMMSEDAVKVHMAERHKGDSTPPIELVHAMIDRSVELAQ